MQQTLRLTRWQFLFCKVTLKNDNLMRTLDYVCRKNGHKSTSVHNDIHIVSLLYYMCIYYELVNHHPNTRVLKCCVSIIRLVS